jgi:glycosyltransferase involved in cell wall biosynthesis
MATSSLSVIIPAYNEAENILDTLQNVTAALRDFNFPYEVIVIDDGSKDATAGLVAEQMSKFPHLKLLLNEQNRGFGATYQRGVQAASLDYIVMVHGDNAWGADTLKDLFSRLGQADVIIGYTRQMARSRTLSRTLISKAFTVTLNIITGRNLKYYNGLQIHKAEVLKRMKIHSSGFGFQAEVLVKGLQHGASYVQVPMDLIERLHGESKAFKVKNFIDVAKTIWLICLLRIGLVNE